MKLCLASVWALALLACPGTAFTALPAGFPGLARRTCGISSCRMTAPKEDSGLSLELIQIPMDGTTSPADYKAYVEDACAKRNKRIIRWYIAKVEAGTAHAEVVVADASPATASPPTSSEGSTDSQVSSSASGGSQHSRRRALQLMSVAPLLMLGAASNDFDLDDYGFGGKGSWFDIGELVRAKVKESNDVLIEGNRRLNEEAHFLGQRLQEEVEQDKKNFYTQLLMMIILWNFLPELL